MQSLSSGEDWFEVHNEPLSHACFFCCFYCFLFVKWWHMRRSRLDVFFLLHYVLIIFVSSSSETKREAFLLFLSFNRLCQLKAAHSEIIPFSVYLPLNSQISIWREMSWGLKAGRIREYLKQYKGNRDDCCLRVSNSSCAENEEYNEARWDIK